MDLNLTHVLLIAIICILFPPALFVVVPILAWVYVYPVIAFRRWEKKQEKERLDDLVNGYMRKKGEWYEAHPEVLQRHRFEKSKLHGTMIVLMFLNIGGIYLTSNVPDEYRWVNGGLLFLLIVIPFLWMDLWATLDSRQSSEITLNKDP